jgi:putative addiction module CopG family antidote
VTAARPSNRLHGGWRSDKEVPMTIVLRAELERRIADKVRSGRYASVDEVVADALAVLDRAEAAERLKADVCAELDGEKPAERGEPLSADAAVARLWDRINRWRRERHETV